MDTRRHYGRLFARPAVTRGDPTGLARRGIVNAVPRFVAGDVVLAFRTMTTDPNDPDLYAVATAYRNARIAGETDNAAYRAAVAAYRERHSGHSSIPAVRWADAQHNDRYG